MGLIHRPPRVLFLDEARHRPRPRGPGGHVGRDRPPVGRRGPDHPAPPHPLTTHYLEEAARLRRAAWRSSSRGRVVRPPGRAGTRAQGRAARRRHPRRARRNPEADGQGRRRAGPGALGLGGLPSRAAPWRAGPATASADRPGRASRPWRPGGSGADRLESTIARPSLDDVYLRHTGRFLHPGGRGGRPDERDPDPLLEFLP